MPMCIVKGCMNRSSMKNRTQEVLEETVKITFHTLPKNESRRQLWLTSLEVNELSLPKQAVVCSVHFISDDFDTSSLVYRRLKSHAVPYVQIPEDTGERRDTYTGVPNEESSSFSLPNNKVINNSYIFDEPMECVSRKHSMDSISMDEPLNKVAKLKSPSKNECLQTLQEIDESVQVKMSCVDKSTCISPKRLFFSPRKEQLRQYAAKMKRSYQNQLKSLKQKYKRMSKKCANMETILHSLEKKNLLQGEHIEALRGISNFNIKFCQRLNKKSAKQPVARVYSPELRLFALTLHYYSPRAYSYVREKFNSCIPHPKTLYKWYRSIDGEPGFNNEAIRHITEYNKSIQGGLFATLVIDEMAIRQQIEFTGTGHSGVVDVGKVFACDTENIAKEALVFLLVGLNRAWKIPVGYFLIESINGEQKCNLVQQCLKLLHETGVNVVCLTCDGAGNNITMAKALGCNFTNPQSLQTHFPHPMTTEPVYFMLDPCHLLKLIRNTLGDYKCILNPTKERVEWKYIVALHDLQDQEGLHLGNKLNKRHIEYHKNKMKVKYAVQVLSSSVSHAICICRTDLQLTQFRESRATEEFISLLNDLFDILNSRNLRQQKYKRPINPENYSDIEKKLFECKTYILNLTTENGQKLTQSPRKIGFLGLLICIETVIKLYADICKTEYVSHIPTYQCSQDHVELFFCCIRSFGRTNHNPTARQFKGAFKKLLLHNEVKSLNNGNCTALYNIPILHYSSAISIQIINSSTDQNMFHHNLETFQTEFNEFEQCQQIIELHNYSASSVEDTRVYSVFADRIVVYIGGWVVKKLSKRIQCSECINALYEKNPGEIHNLIIQKNRGSLIHPSDDVILICRVCEKVMKFYSIKGELNNFAYIQATVLRRLNMHNLFTNITEHCNNQSPLDNHRVHIIKCVIQFYVNVRCHYISKNIPNVLSRRQYYNKLLLFSGN